MKRLAIAVALAVGVLLHISPAGARPSTGHCASPGFNEFAVSNKAERAADVNKNG